MYWRRGASRAAFLGTLSGDDAELIIRLWREREATLAPACCRSNCSLNLLLRDIPSTGWGEATDSVLKSKDAPPG